MTVEKIPIRYRRPRTLTVEETCDIADPPPEMVWELCPYIRAILDGCQQCPRWEDHEDHGRVQKLCYGLAEEACRVVLAMQRHYA